jgi:CPA1 family monovalent cation:H+ antiporter
MVQQVVLFLLGAFVLALLAEPLARLCRLPYASLLVVLGIGAGQLVEAFRVDTGLDYVVLTDVVFDVLLPLIVYESAQAMDLRALRRHLRAVLLLSVPGFFVTTLVVAAIVAWAAPTTSGWLGALLFGVLVASTDPLAISSQLRSLRAPERIAVVVEGEGTFNDPAAIVLFTVLLGLALAGTEPSVAQVALDFLRVSVGGAFVGLTLGACAWGLIGVLHQSLGKVLASLTFAYASFLAADALAVSGVFATLTVALVVDVRVGRREHPGVAQQLDAFWRVLGYVATAVLFLLVGFAFTTQMFAAHALDMLIAIGAVLVARAAAVFGLLSWFRSESGRSAALAEQGAIVWCGLRGGVTLALVLSLPLELEGWFALQSMAYGVVLFTLLVQAPTIPWVIARLPRRGES